MSTPSAPGPTLGATPQSKGSGRHRDHASKHTQKDYAPYLQEDLLHERTITVAQFFQWILNITDAKNTSRMQRDSQFQKHMSTYNRWHAYTDETQLYKPFVELANYCIGQEAGIRFCRDDPTIVRGSDAQRKPDVISLWTAALLLEGRLNTDHLSQAGPGKDAFHWMELLAFWEFKFIPGGPVPLVSPMVSPISNQLPSPPTAQQAKRKSPVPAPANDRRLRSQDAAPTEGVHAGPPKTTRPSEKPTSNSVTADPEKVKKEDPRTQCASYALELLTYGGFRSHVIGALVTNNCIELLYYDRSIIVKSESFDFSQDTVQFITMLKGIYERGVLTHPFGGSTIELNNGQSLAMGETIFQAHGIIGRGTCVWPAETRTPEADLVKKAVALATGSESKASWVLNHLPKILHAEQIEFGHDSPQQYLSQHFGVDYELRVLRIVVQEPLRPITELTTAAEFLEAFQGILKCYYWLHEIAHIMHRDISRNNLMYRKIDGKIYGVLNDFDLSSPTWRWTSLRTGPPPPHLPRFDLESLFYVMVYIVYQYHEGKKIDKPPFDAWDHSPTTTLHAQKREFLAEPMKVRATSKFRPLHQRILLLHEMFGDGYNERKKAVMRVLIASASTTEEDASEEDMLWDTFDHEILGDTFDNEKLAGNVTFTKFGDILGVNLRSIT
ncbi:hypothetical protein B0H14DRAFT_3864988 [Mycena olivaceomarginata]|nr:hypothetical protein B0H14DRAFT_3864988 [Mycena olivaceomarginata]